MRTLVRLLLVDSVLLMCGGAVPATAQNTPISVNGSGTVTGHVICGDTQRPARFASVTLFGIPSEVTLPPSTPPDPNDAAAMKTALRASFGANMVLGETGLDGSFVLNNVPPGDYYVFPSVAGYVQPVSVVKAAYATGADVKKPLPGVPVVHVAADRTANVEVSAERGAAISGNVSWDDGSPVARTMVLAESPGQKSELPTQFAMLAGAGAISGLSQISDDQGHFRITGLLPGEYVIRANVSTGTQFSMVGGAMQLNGMMAALPLVVYAPDKVHKSAAQSVKVTEGEQREEDITVRLGGMHSVSGRIRSVADGHGINSAMVKLTDASDKDFVRSAGVDADGDYTVTLVPPGTYNLSVSDAEDTKPSSKKPTGLIKIAIPETVRSYEDGKSSVVVTDGDVTGENVDLEPAREKKSKPDLNDLFKDQE